jgi:hypothetical protein
MRRPVTAVVQTEAAELAEQETVRLLAKAPEAAGKREIGRGATEPRLQNFRNTHYPGL